VVLCAGKVDQPMNAVRHVLDRLDLKLNESKTHVVDARQESFNQRRAGNQRMPWCEEHRKAVCVNSARTV